MTLKVIGAGFGRTGTDSMREALNILGLGPCHHMFEVNAHEEQKRLWRALAKGAAPEWEKLFAGYSSCVDWPSAYYWRELAEFFPEAKVVLTYRSPESWWTSFEQTIVRGLAQTSDMDSVGITLVRDRVFGNRLEREHCIAIYEANVNAVKAALPASRLLVHNLGDGWASLCTHLGVAVPAVPYPSRNNASDFQNNVLRK
jgi:hypothetical protein